MNAFNKFKWFIYSQRLYLPILPYWLYLGMKAKSLAFFAACNPKMRLGGFANDPKFEQLKFIQPAYLPKTILISNSEIADIENLLELHKMDFPIIAKPNIGERGFGVRRLDNLSDFENYALKSKKEFLLQEYINFPHEICVLYHKMPGQDKGEITSIGYKDFLIVEGDGTSTFRELIYQNDSIRKLVNLKKIEQIIKDIEFDSIPKQNEKRRISYVANRGGGVVFRDYNHIHSPMLEALFDRISSTVPDFYYGRFDVKILNLDNLFEENGLKIIELNGVNGQPIHCYDARYTMREKYSVMFKHWKIIYHISQKNHQNGVPYPSFWQMIKEIRTHIARH